MSSPTPKSVVILTSGLSGSSVLAGLLVHAGLWPGAETCRKEDYDTFENRELIRLNNQLFEAAGYKGDYTREVSQQAIADIAALGGRIDMGPFRAMLDKCEQHRPWLWKDPRLWLTIRFWGRLLKLQECRFIHLTRDARQLWVSSLLRRQILSRRYLRSYEDQVRNSITGFLEENRLPHLHTTYEALIGRPDDTIARLNRYLGTSLSVADLEAVYHGPLYRTPRGSWAGHAKALLIYARNFSERHDIERKQVSPPGRNLRSSVSDRRSGSASPEVQLGRRNHPLSKP